MKIGLLALAWILPAALAAAAPAAFAGGGPSSADADKIYRERVARILAATPLIDGHNDLPWEIRERFKGRLSAIDLGSDTSQLEDRARRARR